MDPTTREFMCITTKPPSPNDTNFSLDDEKWTPDACWSQIINGTAEYNVIYVGNETACILNLPPDVRAAIIRWMTAKFDTSSIDCHVMFENDETGNSVTGYTMLALLFVSMMCLILTVVVYAVKKELFTVPGLNLTCLCISHFVHYLVSTINLFNIPHYMAPVGACRFFGFMRHFSILATFLWFNVMAYDVWRTVAYLGISNPKRGFNWKRFLKYSSYAWGMSLVIGISAVIVDHIDSVPQGFKPMYRRPHVNDPDVRCTMKTTNIEGFLIYNVTPRVSVLLVNLIFFVLTARAIHKISKKAEILRSTRRVKTRFRLYLKLFIIMGLAWIINVADFIIYARIGPDWFHSGPKWFNVISSYVTVFIGIAIYVTFGLIPTISIVRQLCGKTEKRLSTHSTLRTATTPTTPTTPISPSNLSSIRFSNGNGTIATKF